MDSTNRNTALASALVEELAFTRVSTRSADGRPNFGGVLKATLRKL